MSDQRTSEHADGASGLLAAVLASCRDAIIACSLDGVVEEWNRGAEEVFGISHDSALGESVSRFVPTDRRDEIDRLVTESMAGRAVAHYETERLRASGESFPAAVCGFPLRNAAGEVTGFATIERDLSDRVRGADALREALATAESASQTKSRLLANVSHELRTPMNAIMGMTSLALEEELPAELRDYLETIRDSSETMVGLINDVLDLSRFECDEFELEEVEFAFREIVEAATKALSIAAHAKGLQLVCRVAPKTPEVVIGDPARMRQVLTNLIGNAVKFTSQGQIVVEATPLMTESARCRIQLSVTDTGIGINEKDQTRIFAPFTQVDGSSVRNYGGTGLGLAITRHLVECFGSKLRVESEVGRGSRFWFEITLPLPEEKSTGAHRAATSQIRGLRALVVDDNAASRSTLVEQFTAWGMFADVADSGAAALDKLRNAAKVNNSYDIAMIDAQMPDIDGFSIVSHIKGDQTVKTKPILMAATADRLGFSRRCAEAGATAFLLKPIGQSQLFNAVSQATGAAASESASRLGLYDRPPVAPRRVLLVEDTPANRKVVQRVLQRRGHEVVVAVNGGEAIEVFRQGAYDLVLMDVQMPVKDGLQATEAIRDWERQESRRPTPIVAMTAHSLRGDRERCLRAGMNGYLAKPLDLAELLDLVESGGGPAQMEPNPAQPINARMQSDMSALDNQNPVPADMPTALARMRDDKGLLCDMIGFFLEDSPRMRETLRESHQAGDYATLHRTAHSLKGLVANFDAHPAIEASRDLEDAAKNEEADAIPALLDRVDHTCDELIPFLEAYRQTAE